MAPLLSRNRVDCALPHVVVINIDMKWGVVSLMVIAGMMASLRFSAAEMWCGNGLGTPLNHPCTDADDVDNPAIEAVIKKYQNAWILVDGVLKTEEAETYNSRPVEIQVSCEPASMRTARKKIPSSVNGFPIVFVRGEPAYALPAIYSLPVDPEEEERKQKIAEDNESSDAVMAEYGDRWNDLPGVISVDQHCKEGDDEEPCRYRNITILVQHELLSSVQSEVPEAVRGVPIKVVPDR